MKTHTHTDSAPIKGEEELTKRIARLHKRDDIAVKCRIAVLNDAGELRLSIETFTQSEEDGVCQLLDDRNFEDGITEEVIDSGFEEGSTWEVESFRLEGFDIVYKPIAK